MGQHADVRNFKDFLQLYNRITELCFSHCVDNFFNRNLSSEEGQCVDKCVHKFTQFNQRMMGVYVEVQTTINQRRLEELETQVQQQAQQQQTQEISSLPSSSPQSQQQQENITSKILEQNQSQSIEIVNDYLNVGSLNVFNRIMNFSICTTVLIGLPGAGKTTFCKNLLKNCYLFNLIYICYDNYIQFNFNENNYKSQRKILLERIENCIKCIQEKHEIPQEYENNSKISKENTKYLILIDDNNYYRGMRYEFFQLSRKLRISFGQIYFNCSLEFALKQNSFRKSTEIIPDDIIQKMNERLEKPLKNNFWERNTFTIQSQDNVDFIKVYDFLNNCFQTVESESIIVKNFTVDQSEIHKIDLQLRKAINYQLKNLKSRENIGIIAEKLNEKRKLIIKDFKLGLIQVSNSDDFSEIISTLKIE